MDIKNFIKNNIGNNAKRLQILKTKFPHQYNEIFKITMFLPSNSSLSERVYCICHDIEDIKVCNKCKKCLVFKNFISGYKDCTNLYCIQENGLTIAQSRGKKLSAVFNSIQSNGMTLAENRGKKQSLTKNKIQPNGLTLAQNSGKNCSKTLKQIQPNGLSISQERARKAAETKINKIVNGLNVCQLAGKKSIETRKKIGSDGLTGNQRNTRNMMRTMSKLDENGLSGFERAFKNGAGRNTKLFYHSSGLSYQGKLEKKFLDLVSENKLINKIKKPKPIAYEFKNNNHLYHPDFCYDNLLIEIKSTWTYDNHGKNIELRKLNHLKWKTAILQKFELCIIWDNEYITFLKLKDFESIEKSVYSTKIKFDKNILKNILNKKVQ